MNIDIRFDQAQHQAVVDRLIALQRAGDDLRPILTVIGGELQDIALQRFEAEAAPDGTPWAPLQPGTLAEKRELNYADTILQRQGDLSASIAVSDATPTSIAVGSNLVYAAHHQFGSKPEWPWRLPARPFLGVAPAHADQILSAIRDHFAEP